MLYYCILVVILYTIISNIIYAFKTFLLTRITKGINFKKQFGEWAVCDINIVVTGCTQGIGLMYCKELAARGINLVMISLLADDLAKVSKEIEDEYKVKIKTIQADFSQGFQLYDKLNNELKDIPVGILVNNVGVGMPVLPGYEAMSIKNILDHITINISAVAMMSHMLLPGMKLRKKGAIVNIASQCSIAPHPHMTSYAASKAYVNQFSRSLNAECKGSGVIIQTIIPYFVSTDLVKNIPIVAEESVFVPDAKTFVKDAIRTLGVSDYTSGYFMHGLVYSFTMLSPEWFYNYYMQLLKRKIDFKLLNDSKTL